MSGNEQEGLGEDGREVLEGGRAGEVARGPGDLLDALDAARDPLLHRRRGEAPGVEEAVEGEVLLGVVRLLADEGAHGLAERRVVDLVEEVADAADEVALARREGDGEAVRINSCAFRYMLISINSMLFIIDIQNVMLCVVICG